MRHPTEWDGPGFASAGRRRGQIVVIASGKGGVGKSDCALNLGVWLARRGVDTVLVDADYGLANLDLLLNVTPLAHFGELLAGTRPVSELLMRGPAGLRVLCGVSGPRPDGAPASAASCAEAFDRLRAACAVALVDCGAGVSPLVCHLALAGDRLLLVTTPEPTAVADAYATLKFLVQQGYDGPVGVLVNQAARSEAEATARRMQRVARQFLGLSVELLGHVPTDRHVPLAVRAREPAALRFPRCPASVCLAAVAQRLVPPTGAKSAAPAGVWSRVASLFL
jgi:flagellar biosynthesis protein FlhG